MDLVSAFFWIAYFTAFYGVFIGLAWLADKFLWKRFGKGLFPKDYFK